MPYDLVSFDLDGTLVDTAPDLHAATNHVLGQAGHAAVPGHELRPYISFGSRRMIQRGLELHGCRVVPAELDTMFQALLAFYADNIAVDSRPYPHLEVVLDVLSGRGMRLAVCTNKVEGHSRKLLAALGLDARFAAICGRDTFTVCKPDPGHLTGTIAQAGGDPRHAIMVGDSDTDVSTARAAGIPVIGVTFGYTDVPMRDLRPDALIDHYAEFGAALDDVSRRAGWPSA